MGLSATPAPRATPTDEIFAALGLLKQGGVVAVPTDTLYGLAASALDQAAVERVFRIKRRSPVAALPLLLGDFADMSLCADDVSPLAFALADRFWPGPLTLVLRRSAVIPDAVTGGGDTVAVRVPDHPVPRALARALKAPITGTSANRSGGPGPITAAEVRAQLGDEVDRIIDAGECPLGAPSTVLDMTRPVPVLLRAGAVSLAEIEQAIGVPVTTG
jgi:L-threonylcarbamoyladenylate synthase